MAITEWSRAGAPWPKGEPGKSPESAHLATTCHLLPSHRTHWLALLSAPSMHDVSALGRKSAPPTHATYYRRFVFIHSSNSSQRCGDLGEGRSEVGAARLRTPGSPALPPAGVFSPGQGASRTSGARARLGAAPGDPCSLPPRRPRGQERDRRLRRCPVIPRSKF